MNIGIKNIKNELTLKVVNYIMDKYEVSPEFLWERNPGSAAFRNPVNRKWFAALMLGLPKKRFGIQTDDYSDVINLKCEPLFISLTIDGKGLFRGYHMNNENWISVFLDGTVPFEIITGIIDMSYEIIDSK